MRVTVQPMNKDDVNVGWSRRGDFGQTKTVNRWNLCFGRSLWKLVENSRVRVGCRWLTMVVKTFLRKEVARMPCTIYTDWEYDEANVNVVVQGMRSMQ